MDFVGLMGLLFLGFFVAEMYRLIQRRRDFNKQMKEQERDYRELLRKGKDEDALEKYHVKKYREHPSFCRCTKCSVKRFFG